MSRLFAVYVSKLAVAYRETIATSHPDGVCFWVPKQCKATRSFGLRYRSLRMFGYSTELRSLTSGMATFSMEFACYRGKV